MERIILHIDVNNAFLSWTAVDILNRGSNFDIRTIPSVICSSKSNRAGIILAKSMPAKKLGIVSGAFISEAQKKCPSLKTYAPNYELYQKMSKKFFSLLYKYTTDIEIASIDECYMDYGKVKNIYGNEIDFAYKLKDEIKNKLGFTVNIGIANNKLCAKMASDFEKPDKVHTLFDNEVKTKMWPLPIGDLFGVGKQTRDKLLRIGINTISDLANFDSYRLSKYFKNSYKDLINIANGIDNSEIINYEEAKGISNEITLNEDINSKEELYPYLTFLSNKVSKRLKEQNKYASVICLILKDNYFRRFNHQKKIKNPTNRANDIYEVSKELLHDIWDNHSIRLVGIRLDNLTNNYNYQTSLFDTKDRIKEDKIDDLIDNINKKYGKNIIKKGEFK